PELVAAQQELLTAASMKESQPQLYKAVRTKLKLWKLSENQINSIETSGKVKEFFPVFANVSGTVSEIMSAEGEYVKKGQPIAKVSDLSTVWAEFDAYETGLSQFRKGQKININTSAYPQKRFEGEISFIDPVLNNSTRTVTIRATLNNRDGLFKPGMFVTGKIEAVDGVVGESILRVPASSILWTGERSLVYVKVKADEPVFEMREVVLGLRSGEHIEILSGLDAGEEIVTNGVFTVDAAAQLQGKKSMMNKTGEKSITSHENHSGVSVDKYIDEEDISTALEFSDSFEKNFKRVLRAYIKLKDAFVSSNARQVSNNANETLRYFRTIDMSDMGTTEKSLTVNSIEMLEAIIKTEDLDIQRAYFVDLNENMVALAINLRSVDETLYVQYCPMANNNEGAVWLSTEEDIRNPYYGDAMLKCGSIKELISFNE
ncbi:MAG: efflux RND transporter periplasmic adaptor subunit, partial [Bacteroidia bacterium]|nr:efflux RND transporter periplasmic adaptor subunit [Bacteroidia bacterium]